VNYTFTISEATRNFTVEDITIKGGTAGTFTKVSPTTYTLAVTPSANSSAPITVDVAAGSFTNASGNNNVAATQNTQAIDTAAPTVVLSSNVSSIKAGQTATITATFSEAVTGFSDGDITSGNGAFSSLVQSQTDPKVYTTTFTPTSTSTASDSAISIAAGSYTDAVGNSGTVGAKPTLAMDMIASTVVISSDVASLKAGQTATIKATFSEAVSGFTLSDLLSSNGAFSNLVQSTTDAKVYTATFTPTAGSLATDAGISIAQGSYSDVAGNSGSAGAPPTLPMNMALNIAPTITIASDKVGTTTNQVVNYTFTISEATRNFTVEDITIKGGTAGTFTKLSSTSYTLAVTPSANSSTPITVDVAAGTFTNASGNNNVAATQNVQTIDTVLPTVTLSSDMTLLRPGDHATITATFNKVPVGFELSDLLSDNGVFSNLVVNASNPKIYTATFTPTLGTRASDAGISIAAGSYVDSLGNKGLVGLKPTLALDMFAPTVTITSNVSTLKIGETATITATFSEPVTGFTLEDLRSPNGTFSNLVNSATNSKVYTATFTPGVNSPASEANISIAARSYANVAGKIGLGVNAPSISMDVLAPNVDISSNKDTVTSGTVTYTFTLSEPSADFTVDDIILIGGTAGTFTQVSSTVYTLAVTPTGGVGSLDADVVIGSFKDAVGNVNTLKMYTLAEIAQFSPDQMATMTSVDFVRFPLSGMAILTPEQLTAISYDAIGMLSPAQIASLTPTQISLLTADQMAFVTAEQLAALTPAQIAHLTLEEIASIADISVFTVKGISGLTPEQIAILVPEQVSNLTQDQVRSLTGVQIQSLTPQLISLFNDLGELTAQQITAFTPKQIAMLTMDQFSTLTTEQIQVLTLDQLPSLTTMNIRTLADISLLLPKQISVLTSLQIAVLHFDQIENLTTAQVRALTTNQIPSLTMNQIASLTMEQVPALTTVQIQALHGMQVAALSLDDVSVLTTTQVGALTTTQLGALTGNQLSILTPAQIKALTPDKLAVLSEWQTQVLGTQENSHTRVPSYDAANRLIKTVDTSVLTNKSTKNIVSQSVVEKDYGYDAQGRKFNFGNDTTNTHYTDGIVTGSAEWGNSSHPLFDESGKQIGWESSYLNMYYDAQGILINGNKNTSTDTFIFDAKGKRIGDTFLRTDEQLGVNGDVSSHRESMGSNQPIFDENGKNIGYANTNSDIQYDAKHAILSGTTTESVNHDLLDTLGRWIGSQGHSTTKQLGMDGVIQGLTESDFTNAPRFNGNGDEVGNTGNRVDIFYDVNGTQTGRNESDSTDTWENGQNTSHQISRQFNAQNIKINESEHTLTSDDSNGNQSDLTMNTQFDFNTGAKLSSNVLESSWGNGFNSWANANFDASGRLTGYSHNQDGDVNGQPSNSQINVLVDPNTGVVQVNYQNGYTTVTDANNYPRYSYNTDQSQVIVFSGTDAPYDASGAQATTFTILPTSNSSTFSISGLGAGDKLVYLSSQGYVAPAISNGNPSDGVVDLTYSDPSNGLIKTVHLTDLTTAQDAAITSVASFRAVFGQESLQISNHLPTGELTLHGLAKQGQALTVSSTLQDQDGLGALSYIWKANGVDIAGATGSTFVPTQKEVGKTLSATAFYMDALGTIEHVVSNSTDAIASNRILLKGKLSDYQIAPSHEAGVSFYVTGRGINQAVSATDTVQFSDGKVTLGASGEIFAQGPEFRVNTTTTNGQYQPKITGLSDGGFVVTWMDDSNDGSGRGIYGQRYDAQGAAQGGEFRVNTTTTEGQYQPTITGLSDGGFVVTWYSDWNQVTNNGTPPDIYGQRYDAQGAAQGGEFRVNTTTNGSQHQPTITGLSDGGFVVTWMDDSNDGSGWGIYGQRYDAQGAAQGGEFRVNTTTTNEQGQPTITGLSDGGFVVTWNSDWDPATNSWTPPDIYGQRYDAQGAAQGGEFRVNTTTTSSQNQPTITGLSDGGFVVTWNSDWDPVTNSWTPPDIYGQRYDAQGAAQGAEFRVNTTTTNYQQQPTITGLSDGGFVVTWFSDWDPATNSWTPPDIYGQRYDAQGAAQGGEFRVNTTTTNSQQQPTITGLSDGGFVVTWYSDWDPATNSWNLDIYAQRYSAGGDIEFTGNLSSQRITGTDRNDVISGLGGNDSLDGGAGIDTANYSGARSDYTITGTDTGFIIKDNRVANSDGTDKLTNIENLSFSDAKDHLSTGNISIKGLAKQGQTLIAQSTLKDADGLETLSYQWQANGLDIQGATGKNYILTQNEVGKTITLAAQYTDSLGTTEKVISHATDAVESNVIVLKGKFSDYQITPSHEQGIAFYVDAQGVHKAVASTDTVQFSDGTVARGANDETLAQGVEFRVNTTTTNSQQQPTITGLSDGGFVVTWFSDWDPATNSWTPPDIYGQRYDAQGAAQGGEFRVNTTTNGSQYKPTITGLSDGGFVVTWMDDSNEGSGWGIYGQRYDAQGAAQGGELHVNTNTPGEQMSPIITNLKDGGYVVIWQSQDLNNGNIYDICGQRFDSQGNAKDTEFRISTSQSKEQFPSSITGLGDGGFVVVWMSLSLDGTSDIYGQRYDVMGVTQGTEFLINTVTNDEQYCPTVTELKDGGFLVTWMSQWQDGSYWGIYGQRFDAQGLIQGAEFLVNTTTYESQYFPCSTGLSDGGFVITWASWQEDGSGYGVYGQRFDAEGRAKDSQFIINTNTTSDQWFQTISSLSDGGFVVTWMSQEQDGSGWGIYAQRYSAGGDIEFTGNLSSQHITGTDRNDVISGLGGNDSLDGGAGIDTANYSGARSDYTITGTDTGFIIKDNRVTNSDGTDKLTNIENLSFSDVTDHLPTGEISIVGSPRQGKVLAVQSTLKDIDGIVELNYQWLRDGRVIDGANLATYALTQDDVGKTITVKASSLDTLGSIENLSSSGVVISAPSGLLSLSDIRKLTVADVAMLTPSDFAKISPQGIEELVRPSAFNPTLPASGTMNFQAISPESIASFSAAQFKALVYEIPMLSMDQIASLTSTQIQALTPNQINSMSVNQLGILNANQAKAFTDAQLANLDQYRKDQIGSLNYTHTSTPTYDDSGRVIKVIDTSTVSGKNTGITFNPQPSKFIIEKDFQYDASGSKFITKFINTSQNIDPNGNVTGKNTTENSWTYDVNGHPSTSIQVYKNVDTAGNASQNVNETTWGSYDANGNPLTSITVNKNINGAGNVSWQKTIETTWGPYDVNGNPLTSHQVFKNIDDNGLPNGNYNTMDTTWTYDEEGNPLISQQINQNVDSTGNVSNTNETNTAWTYDLDGNKLSRTQTNFNLNGGVKTINGINEESWTYDVNGNQLGHKTTWSSMDGNGHVNNKNINETVWDAAGHQLINTQTNQSFDMNGVVNGGNSNEQTWSYDAAGNLLTSHQANLNYGPNGILNGGNANDHIWTYDVNNHPLTHIETNSNWNSNALTVNNKNEESWTYDVKGNAISHTQTNSNWHGNALTVNNTMEDSWTYDASNHPLTHVQTNSNWNGNALTVNYKIEENWTYDAKGNAITHTQTNSNWNGNVWTINNKMDDSWTYDANNHPLTHLQTNSNMNGTQSFSVTNKIDEVWIYDANGNQTSHKVTNSSFDGNGNITSENINENGSDINGLPLVNSNSILNFDLNGVINGGNSNERNWSYDASGNVLTSHQTNLNYGTNGTLNGGNAIDNTWTYDTKGNAISHTLINSNVNNNVLAINNKIDESWTYDANGHAITHNLSMFSLSNGVLKVNSNVQENWTYNASGDIESYSKVNLPIGNLNTIESFGEYALVKDDAGVYYAKTNDSSSLLAIKDIGGNVWTGGPIIAVDAYQGQKAVVFGVGGGSNVDSYHVWLCDSSWTKVSAVNISPSEVESKFGINLATANIQTIVGTSGDDYLVGGVGSDSIDGGDGADALIGGAGFDTLIGGNDGDLLDGGAGNDLIDGGTDGQWGDIVDYRQSPSAEIVTLGEGTALGSAMGGDGVDTLINVEHIYDSSYNDVLTGNSGDNFFKLSKGDDVVDGAGGYNFVWYAEAPTGVNVTIDSTESGSATDFISANQNIGYDIFTNIQGVVGSNSADLITISSAFGKVKGRMGDDSLVGGVGDQVFIGGSGSDNIDGGSGFDVISYVDDGFDTAFNPLLTSPTLITSHAVQVDLSTGIAIDNWGNTDRFLNIEGVEGSSFTDTLIGGNDADTFIFGPSASLANISPDIIRNYESDKDTLVFTLADHSRASITLATVDTSATIAGSNVEVNDTGLIAFDDGDSNYVQKISAIQNDSGLDLPNQVALFTSGFDSYVYYSGTSAGNTDDQIVKLSNLVGTGLGLNSLQKTVTVSSNGSTKNQITFSRELITVGSQPKSSFIGDLNGDGKLDLVTASWDSNSVSVLLGDGKGGFSNSSDFPTGNNPHAVEGLDLNKDGKLDLVTLNNDTNGYASSLLGNGSGGFSTPQTDNLTLPYVQSRGNCQGDFNNDGILDMAYANTGASSVTVVLGGTNSQISISLNASPHSVRIGDFNNDNKLDLVTSNWDKNNVSVLLGDGIGGFSSPTTFDVGANPASVNVADFNKDEFIDIATGNMGSNSVSILLGDGQGSFSTQTVFQVATGPHSVSLGDFNGDGRVDIATANAWSNNVTVLLNTGMKVSNTYLKTFISNNKVEPISVMTGGETFTSIKNSLNQDVTLWFMSPNGQMKYENIAAGTQHFRQSAQAGHAWEIKTNDGKVVGSFFGIAQNVDITESGTQVVYDESNDIYQLIKNSILPTVYSDNFTKYQSVSEIGSASASNGNIIFDFAEGTYNYTVTDFTVGDGLSFDTEATISNSSFTDGKVDVQCLSNGKVVVVTLTGLTNEQDSAIYSINSFKTVFGASSIMTSFINGNAPQEYTWTSITINNTDGTRTETLEYVYSDGRHSTQINVFSPNGRSISNTNVNSNTDSQGIIHKITNTTFFDSQGMVLNSDFSDAYTDLGGIAHIYQSHTSTPITDANGNVTRTGEDKQFINGTISQTDIWTSITINNTDGTRTETREYVYSDGRHSTQINVFSANGRSISNANVNSNTDPQGIIHITTNTTFFDPQGMVLNSDFSHVYTDLGGTTHIYQSHTSTPITDANGNVTRTGEHKQFINGTISQTDTWTSITVNNTDGTRTEAREYVYSDGRHSTQINVFSANGRSISNANVNSNTDPQGIIHKITNTIFFDPQGMVLNSNFSDMYIDLAGVEHVYQSNTSIPVTDANGNVTRSGEDKHFINGTISQTDTWTSTTVNYTDGTRIETREYVYSDGRHSTQINVFVASVTATTAATIAQLMDTATASGVNVTITGAAVVTGAAIDVATYNLIDAANGVGMITGYSLSDTAANLISGGAALSAIASGVNVAITGAAIDVATYNLIDVANGVGMLTGYSLSDTAVNLISGGATASAIASGVNVTITDTATLAQLLTVNAATTGLVTATATTSISGSAANVKLVTDAIGSSGDKIALSAMTGEVSNVNVTVSDAARVAQALAIDAASSGNLVFTTGISDNAAAFAGADGTIVSTAVTALLGQNPKVTITDSATLAQLLTVNAATSGLVTATATTSISGSAANVKLVTDAIGSSGDKIALGVLNGEVSNVTVTIDDVATLLDLIAINAKTSGLVTATATTSISGSAANVKLVTDAIGSSGDKIALSAMTGEVSNVNVTVSDAASVAQALAIDVASSGTLVFTTGISDNAAAFAGTDGTIVSAAVTTLLGQNCNVTITDAATIAQLIAIDDITTGIVNYTSITDTAANLATLSGSTWTPNTTYITHGKNVFIKGAIDKAEFDAIDIANDTGRVTLLDLRLSAPTSILDLRSSEPTLTNSTYPNSTFPNWIDPAIITNNTLVKITNNTVAKINDASGNQTFEIEAGGKLVLENVQGHNEIKFDEYSASELSVTYSGTTAIFTASLDPNHPQIVSIAMTDQGVSQTITYSDGSHVEITLTGTTLSLGGVIILNTGTIY
jgi:hypothetical protein